MGEDASATGRMPLSPAEYEEFGDYLAAMLRDERLEEPLAVASPQPHASLDKLRKDVDTAAIGKLDAWFEHGAADGVDRGRFEKTFRALAELRARVRLTEQRYREAGLEPNDMTTAGRVRREIESLEETRRNRRAAERAMRIAVVSAIAALGGAVAMWWRVIVS